MKLAPGIFQVSDKRHAYLYQPSRPPHLRHSRPPANPLGEYIEDQEEHRRKISLETELLSYPKKHGMEYDERYIWA